MKKILISLILLACIFGNANGANLFYRDNKGHYHFKCTGPAKVGRIVLEIRASGILIKGSIRNNFWRFSPETDNAHTIKHKKAKYLNMVARYGCGEPNWADPP